MAAESDKIAFAGMPTAPNPQDGSSIEVSVEGKGHLRIKGDAIDTAVLRENITFPFSGRVAKNRMLKAPMTERLCRWPDNHQEDNVTLHMFPSPIASISKFSTQMQRSNAH
jgi:hypothetical protein